MGVKKKVKVRMSCLAWVVIDEDAQGNAEIEDIEEVEDISEFEIVQTTQNLREMAMRHKKGNCPKCNECEFYRERTEGEKLRDGNDGWCVNKKAQGINGHKPVKTLERVQVSWNGCCHLWIDAESGHTKFEVLTGYKEPYDGSCIQLN